MTHTPLFLLPFLLLTMLPAYGTIGDGIDELIDDSIKVGYDSIMEAVVIPDDNIVGTSQEELDNVKDSGKDFIIALKNLFGATHSLADSGVQAVDQDMLEPWMTSLIGVGVVALVAIPAMKKFGFDLLKIVVLSIAGVVIFIAIGLIF